MGIEALLDLSPIEATRRNHGLEHATVAVLLERGGFRRSIAGRSTPSGFYIYGDITKEELASAADEALDRLQRGEAHWAVSPFCGTNLAVAGVLAAVSILAVSGSRDRRGALPNAILAGIGSVLASQPVGRLMQKYITTSPHLLGVRVVNITQQSTGPIPTHFVRTARISG